MILRIRVRTVCPVRCLHRRPPMAPAHAIAIAIAIVGTEGHASKPAGLRIQLT